jgi:hypothetical protein
MSQTATQEPLQQEQKPNPVKMSNLGPWGHQILSHMQENRPKEFRELKRSGKLLETAWDMEDKAKIAMSNLIDQGYKQAEALEIIQHNYLFLAPESQEPSLGHSSQVDPLRQLIDSTISK